MATTDNSVPRRRTPKITGGIFTAIGLVLALGGLWLVTLGGSWYYLLAGLGVAATGVLVWRGRAAALPVYALVLLATTVWALVEVGLVGWQLEPRLLAPLILGLWLLLPWVRRRLTGPGALARRASLATATSVVVAAVVLAIGFAQPVGTDGRWSGFQQPATDPGLVAADDWQFYGRTPHGDRFSPLTQITPANVSRLQVAWHAHTGDTIRPGEDKGGTDAGHEFNFENTPIKIADTLYVCTGHSWVEAFDAATGRMKWRFDPRANTGPDVYLACRGVAYYAAPAGRATPCPRRIIAPVLDGRIMALNADTGRPCTDFGQNGFISLTKYLGHVPAGFHFVTSPPLVLHDRMILGGWVYDNQAESEPSGAVRAFDPVTGAIVWAWDVGHPDQVVHPTDATVLTRGTPNAWGVYTADPALNMVYLPLGNATPDYYGGNRRPFDDAYNSSIVALDITTGQPRWHFQTTHHDVWDMDLPIGPSLVDLPANGGTVPALVQTTKRGEFFMLDRRTGRPVAQVVERRVPTDGVPGDRLSPTQPYSTGMPSLTPPTLTEASMWGATPLDQLSCRIKFRASRYEGQFTPPGTRATIVYPAFDGVIDWHGASIDPERKLLIANASYIPFIVRLWQREKKANKVPPWHGQGDEPEVKDGLAPMYGTPYVGKVQPWLNLLGVPCTPPPWGTQTAIDLKTRKIVWQHALGTTQDTGPFFTHVDLPLKTGIFNIGGNMVTRAGLVFQAGTADDYLRAMDVRDGRILWRGRLPAGGQANPMSYAMNGRQYVVIAAGGHSALGTRSGDSLVAYALPR